MLIYQPELSLDPESKELESEEDEPQSEEELDPESEDEEPQPESLLDPNDGEGSGSL